MELKMNSFNEIKNFLVKQHSTSTQFCIFMLLTTIRSLSGAPVDTGNIHTTLHQLTSKEYLVQLPFEIRIFGNAKFTSFYINPVGSVSFENSIPTSRLDQTKNKAIIFAPLLLLHNTADTDVDITVNYGSEGDGTTDFAIFKNIVEDDAFVIKHVLSITWHETLYQQDTGNMYRIHFLINDDKTYVHYDYVTVTHIQDKYGYAKAGIFAIEDGSVMCATELPESQSDKLLNVEDFTERVDLPLECDRLDFDCKDPPKRGEEDIFAERKGFFFETHTTSSWSFYILYMCLPNHIKKDKSVSIKQGCVDDPDYYVYSWRELSEIDTCILSDDISSTTGEER
ncbi:uncharacterized protein LOC144428159 [Styela clava]